MLYNAATLLVAGQWHGKSLLLIPSRSAERIRFMMTDRAETRDSKLVRRRCCVVPSLSR